MSRRIAELAAALRVCPLCQSSAVSDTRTDGPGSVSGYRLRCGECGTWRGALLGLDDARALDRRFARKLRRDRRRLERMLRRLETRAARRQPELTAER